MLKNILYFLSLTFFQTQDEERGFEILKAAMIIFSREMKLNETWLQHRNSDPNLNSF